MPRPKKVEVQLEAEEVLGEMTQREKLEARREELLHLFHLIQNERVAVPAQLEVKLSQVNEELIKLGD